MRTRREVVLAGLAGLAGWPGLSCAQSPRHNPMYGVLAATPRDRRVLHSKRPLGLYVTGDEPMIPQSDDRELDYALAHTLARISDAFQVTPGFAYYNDFDAKNAYATGDSKKIVYGGGQYDRPDGTVLFGQGLLKRCMASN